MPKLYWRWSLITIYHVVIKETKLALDGIHSGAEFFAQYTNKGSPLFPFLSDLDLELDGITSLEEILLVGQARDAKFVCHLFRIHYNYI